MPLQKRIQRDACSPQYSVTFDDVTRNIAGLTVSSATGNCDAGLMVNANQVTGANANPRVRAGCWRTDQSRTLLSKQVLRLEWSAAGGLCDLPALDQNCTSTMRGLPPVQNALSMHQICFRQPLLT
jgi:hypothetical protein